MNGTKREVRSAIIGSSNLTNPSFIELPKYPDNPFTFECDVYIWEDDDDAVNANDGDLSTVIVKPQNVSERQMLDSIYIVINNAFRDVKRIYPL